MQVPRVGGADPLVCVETTGTRATGFKSLTLPPRERRVRSAAMEYKIPAGFPLSAFESIQGRRWNMEDAHVNIDDMSEIYKDLPKSAELFVAALTLTLRAAPKMSFYAIFDGHGGRISAELCEHHLLDYVLGTEAFKKGEYVEALKEGFHKMEGMIAERARTGGPGSMTDGCTAVAILVVDTKIYCANIGDSEAIVGRMKKKEEVKNPDDVYDFTLLTEKHLPSEAAEKERLQKAGATIISNRVNGILAVSRSFGDLEFKAKTPKGVPAVIVDPHVMTYDIGPLDQFIVLACDGLWDTTTYEEAVRFI